ncbi:MAG: hypothetical protein HY736_08095 [Verrucomicrobia bacterium]|nr:hypothetical protein [Verrucomicrobiota bacterium]
MTDAAQRFPLILAGVAASACLGFAAYTGHTWEDYFITFRSSLNLASGNGLVYQPGERVHTFTSPLGTLLPALFAAGGGEHVAVRALWWFRLLSAAAAGGAVWLAARTLVRDGLAPVAVGAACAMWAFDPKMVDFAINGMESALLVLFVVIAWWALTHRAAPWPIALGFAGLQWTRPDGVVFFAALAAAGAFFGAGAPGGNGNRRWPALVRGVGLGLALYLPWVICASVYYGSPIPHTVQAKISHHPPGELAPALLLYPWRLLFGHTALHDVFQPAYSFFGGWPAVLAWTSRLVAVGAALAWLLPSVRSAGRVASAAFFLGGFYVEYIPRSPWYYPAWQVLACLAWAFLFDAAAQRGNLRRPARIAAGMLVGLQVALLLGVAWQMKAQQSLIEDGHRTKLGQWLRVHAAPNDRVYLEPLGYIGFFSGLKMLDHPGLASPEVVAARRAGARTHAQVVAALRPEWLVLRPDQAGQIRAENPPLLERDYGLARQFDVRADIDSIRFLPGRGYLEFDAVFLVYRRAMAPPLSRE